MRNWPFGFEDRTLHLSRRQSIGLLAGALAGAGLGPANAQDQAQVETAGEPFSFDILTEWMRTKSRSPYRAPKLPEGFLGELDYDDYRLIQFDPAQARWKGEDAPFELHAYHLGWLFQEPVEIYEITDGTARAVNFTYSDFQYRGDLADTVPEEGVLPGVAGFRLNAPLNQPDHYDELVSFLGASYFRALGRGNVYGISARGLAINTAMGSEEEFPRFSAFWIERPAEDAEQVVIYAALESPSVTGAYRFILTPGETTQMEVTTRLFFRAPVDQIGVAPLTSMFLFGASDEGAFDDYRAAVHDSEVLLLQTDGDTFVRALNNPPRLANSYLGAVNPRSFGLYQRSRDFDDYLDAGAHYERRPSLRVEPMGDWGPGSVRLIELPSDLEANDNIVAFWVPEAGAAAGDEREFSYRLHWGMAPGPEQPELGHIVRTMSGHGGVAGIDPLADRRKFVIDFEGGQLAELDGGSEIEAEVSAGGGEILQTGLSPVQGTGLWRLVIEVSAPPGAIVELRALLELDGAPLTETWLYQWMKP
ncbi:glucan biosynthesis protein [Pseudoroseicyclus tamaricis]|uniref:Glucan biosynthesis protein n=1 Tax=Pseudoroseicyclus tamaricis TaxID=2705421 RepID=A0A6B2JT48_9RHOB|nr:glucan biosynthesis protein G [Pseudoroseicyclus tamaricis]NDV01205.1 glucan biosynthesis protein [Pseudoroseicyclus tamaricis]